MCLLFSILLSSFFPFLCLHFFLFFSSLLSFSFFLSSHFLFAAPFVSNFSVRFPLRRRCSPCSQCLPPRRTARRVCVLCVVLVRVRALGDECTRLLQHVLGRERWSVRWDGVRCAGVLPELRAADIACVRCAHRAACVTLSTPTSCVSAHVPPCTLAPCSRITVHTRQPSNAAHRSSARSTVASLLLSSASSPPPPSPSPLCACCVLCPLPVLCCLAPSVSNTTPFSLFPSLWCFFLSFLHFSSSSSFFPFSFFFLFLLSLSSLLFLFFPFLFFPFLFFPFPFLSRSLLLHVAPFFLSLSSLPSLLPFGALARLCYRPRGTPWSVCCRTAAMLCSAAAA